MIGSQVGRPAIGTCDRDNNYRENVMTEQEFWDKVFFMKLAVPLGHINSGRITDPMNAARFADIACGVRRASHKERIGSLPPAPPSNA